MVVGDNVTLNFSGEKNFYSGFCDLQQLSTATPTTINVEPFANAFLRSRHVVYTDVLVQRNGTLTIKDTYFVANGTVSGEGELYMSSGSLTCSSVSVQTAHFSSWNAITTGQLNASSLVAGDGTLSVTAGESYVGNLISSSHTTTFNGDYIQTGGLVNISLYTTPSAPLIKVNGSVTLSSVAFYLHIDRGFTTNKIVLFESLTKSLSATGVTYQHIASDDSDFHITHSDSQIYLERSAVKQFFVEDWIYIVVAVAGIFVLTVALVIIRKLMRKKAQPYSRIN